MSISVNLDTINAKSIDLTFDVGDLLSTDIINITGLNAPAISTIFNETYTSATLLFDSILTFGESYEVTIEREGTVISTLNFVYNEIVSIETAELICNGTNSFTLNFKYPVELTPVTPPVNPVTQDVNDTISPFLFLASNKALGLPNIPADSNNKFVWGFSDDLKSINIESHEFPFNIGNVSIFTNYPSLFDEARPGMWVTEFEEAGIKIPPILSEGIIDSVGKEPTAVCNFTQYNGSKEFFIAEFCDNILFMKDEITLIIDGGTPIIGTRTPYNSPNAVLFDASIDLAPGVYSISIPSIYDANMNKTVPYEGLLVINDVDPIVEAAEAIDANNVRVTFNTLMNEISDTSDPNFAKSALKSLNYILKSLDGLPYDGEILDVISETLPGDVKTSVILELSKPLSFGNYEVTVNDVVSLAGTSLISNTANFLFKDTEEPTVTIIGYGKPDATDKIVFDDTNQKIIIKYNKAMNIIPTKNAADDNVNFAIKYAGEDLTEFDPLTEIVNVSKAYQNRFRLPLTTDLDLTGLESDKLKILVGYNNYVDGENIQKRVSSTSGSHVKITEDGRAITLFAWPMKFCDSAFAKMSLVLPNQILYSYNETDNNNEFYKVAYENMTFTLTGGIPVDEPLVIDVNQEPKIVNDGKSILFTFVGDINQDATDIKVTQLADGDIIDFFDGAVTMDGNTCTLKLDRDMVQPVVKAASIVALDASQPLDSNPVKVALLFNKQLKYTSDDNFIITDSSLRELQVPTSRILFGSANPESVPDDVFNANYGYLPPSSDLTIIEICGELNRNINSSNALLTVASNLDPQQMDTEDIHSNVVKPFEMPIANIKSKSFSINPTPNDDDETLMDAEFRLSLFEEINTDWFNEFKFGEKDINGKYTLNAELKASYMDNDTLVELTDSQTIPANKLVTQTFDLTKTLTPERYTGSFIPDDIPPTSQDVGDLIAIKDDTGVITGEVCVITSIDKNDTTLTKYEGIITTGEIVTKSYAGQNEPVVGGNRTIDLPVNTVDIITDLDTTTQTYDAVRVTTEDYTCSADSSLPDSGIFINKRDSYHSYIDFVTEVNTKPAIANPVAGTSATEGEYKAYRSKSLANGYIYETMCPLGTITVRYYSAPSSTSSLNIDLDDKVAEVSFTDDLKTLIVNIKKITTAVYMGKITITTNYLIPAPYVLMTRNNMNFINTSFKAIHSNNNNPIS